MFFVFKLFKYWYSWFRWHLHFGEEMVTWFRPQQDKSRFNSNLATLFSTPHRILWFQNFPKGEEENWETTKDRYMHLRHTAGSLCQAMHPNSIGHPRHGLHQYWRPPPIHRIRREWDSMHIVWTLRPRFLQLSLLENPHRSNQPGATPKSSTKTEWHLVSFQKRKKKEPKYQGRSSP